MFEPPYINAKYIISEVQQHVSETMKKIITSLQPTTAKLYHKQYWRFRFMASIKMQTIKSYSVVTV